MNLGMRLFNACPIGDRVRAWLDGVRVAVVGNRTAVLELIDDHATFKTVVDELTTWAETLGAKLNADAGVTDTDYDATITADAPGTLTAGDPDAAPAALSDYE